MPYVYDPNLDPNRDQQPGQAQISGATAVANAAGAPQQTPSKGLNTGSGFQNLDKYLSGNQAQGFGGQVLGKVGDQVQTAKNQMADASSQFKQQVDQSARTNTQEDVNKALANPVANQSQLANWTQQQYKGPTELASNQDAWNKYWSGTKQAQTSAGLLGNESGRFTLLDQYFGKPTYNYGQKSLDNLLVQQSGLGNQTQALQNQAAQLQATGAQGVKDLSQYAGQGAAQVDQARNQAQAATQSAFQQQQQQIANELAQANSARSAQQNSIRDALAQGRAPADVLYQMRSNPANGERRFNLNLADYYTAANPLVAQQTMTPDEQARIGALSQLSGAANPYSGAILPTSPDLYSFDYNRFAADQASKNAAFHAELDPLDKQNQFVNQIGAYSRNDKDALNQKYAQERQAIFDRYGVNNAVGSADVASRPGAPSFHGYFAA